MVGTGVQARSHVDALRTEFSFTEVGRYHQYEMTPSAKSPLIFPSRFVSGVVTVRVLSSVPAMWVGRV